MIRRSGVLEDRRIGGVPTWVLGGDPRSLMRVPEKITQCVAFLASKAPSEANYHYRGTAFFVGVDSPASPETRGYVFVVTAKHIIRRAQALGEDVFLRLNMKDGTSRLIQISHDHWFYSEDETADVAIASFHFEPPGAFDIVIFPSGGFATEEKIAEHEIGIGDDLYISGLFARHFGKERNLPIVRSGIIASMPHEPLLDRDSGLHYDAYLAEVRSIGGLSGSPVFVVLPIGRVRGENVSWGPRYTFLLGLIRGHWERPAETQDGWDPAELDTVNMGIAIVTPIQEVIKVLESEEVIAEMKKADDEHAKEDEPTEDSTFPEEAREYDRFEELTRKLVNTPKPKADEKDAG
jgi:hypothetical protein